MASLPLVQRVWARYEAALKRRPIPTQMATSCVLWGLGDVLAQRVVERKDWAAVDKRRSAMTATFGLGFMGPVGHLWYENLDKMIGWVIRPSSKLFLLGKVVADSLILGPIYVMLFYLWGSLTIDGSGFEGFKHKVTKDFIPTYMAELAVWPAFQTFNFRSIPVQHQLLAVNLATLVDASFLSWARGQDDWVGSLKGAIGAARDKQAAQQHAAGVAKAASKAANS